jgi:hypothetical protein
MTTREEFFQAHVDAGTVNEQVMAELALMPEGEIDETSKSSKPDAATEAKPPEPKAQEPSKVSEVKEPSKAEPDPTTLNAENAVILAKDGKHTIGYEKLDEAREAARVAREAAAAATAESERLRLENESLRKGSSASNADPKADGSGKITEPPEKGTGKPAIDFGDYSDEAVATAVQQIEALVNGKVEERVAAATKDIEAKSLAPMAEKLAKNEVREHYQAIYEAHPDADSVAESKELSDWIDKQPNFAREAYRNALTTGSTSDVVELFSTFKESTGKTGAAQAKAEPAKADKPDAATAAAAKAAIDAAKSKPPTSLSEVVAASSATSDEATAMLDKSSVALMDQFEGKSPEQIHALLNRVL